MKNITENLKRAIFKDVSWANSDFYYFIEILEKNKFEVGFSVEDDERWAIVTVDGLQIAYVWKKSPLMFIRKDHLVSVQIILEKEFDYIEVISIDDLNEDVFSIDLDKELMDRIDYLFNHNSFSANDFWFYNQT
jgi:hypothetical protein